MKGIKMQVTNVRSYESEIGHPHFDDLSSEIADNFKRISDEHHLFTTNVDPEELWNAYLVGFSEHDRQHFNCNACRNFIRSYGGIVFMDENLEIHSALWNKSNADPFYHQSIENVKVMVESSQINGVFFTDRETLGTPISNGWNHFHAVARGNSLVKGFRTAYQVVADKKQNFATVSRSLSRYREEHFRAAVNLLKSGSLYRSEKALGFAEAMYELKRNTTFAKSNMRVNHIWKYVAEKPEGFCHINSSMLGTILEDIEAGSSGEVIARKFKEKMNPMQYQRPQKRASDSNIEQAENIVKAMGCELSLKRRFARIEELPLLWKPITSAESTKDSTGSVFGHLKSEKKVEIEAPLQTISWEKFSKKVLPDAFSIKAKMKNGLRNYSAILTAVHQDAPCIIQWGNHFSHYVYNGGSSSDAWCLPYTGYVDVTGVCLPSHKFEGAIDNGNHEDSVLFILAGAKDFLSKNKGGISLFPEILISELRSVRASIEMYSKEAHLEGFDEASACGIRLEDSRGVWRDALELKVENQLGTSKYAIDRWD